MDLRNVDPLFVFGYLLFGAVVLGVMTLLSSPQDKPLGRDEIERQAVHVKDQCGIDERGEAIKAQVVIEPETMPSARMQKVVVSYGWQPFVVFAAQDRKIHKGDEVEIVHVTAAKRNDVWFVR